MNDTNPSAKIVSTTQNISPVYFEKLFILRNSVRLESERYITVDKAMAKRGKPQTQKCRACTVVFRSPRSAGKLPSIQRHAVKDWHRRNSKCLHRRNVLWINQIRFLFFGRRCGLSPPHFLSNPYHPVQRPQTNYRGVSLILE